MPSVNFIYNKRNICCRKSIKVSASNSYIAGKLCDEIRGFMRDFRVPNGLEAMGFQFSDIGETMFIPYRHFRLRRPSFSERLSAAALNSVENIAVTPRRADFETIAYIYEKSLTVY